MLGDGESDGELTGDAETLGDGVTTTRGPANAGVTTGNIRAKAISACL